jgi:PAS domain S-box-containing protein
VGSSELAGSGGVKPATGAEVTLRRLAESGLIAVATATMEGITEANGAFLRLVGYSEADLAAGPLDWRAMTPPEWAPADQAALAELQATGSCTPFRKEYWRKDGSRVPVEISAVLQSPEPLRWACFIRDVSAEQQAQAAAERGAVLASLAAALSHAATTTEVAEALGVQLRRSTGANLATIIEVDPARPVLRFMDLRDMPEEVARQWAEFDTSLDSPAVRAWRGRAPAFHPHPQTLSE